MRITSDPESTTKTPEVPFAVELHAQLCESMRGDDFKGVPGDLTGALYEAVLRLSYAVGNRLYSGVAAFCDEDTLEIIIDSKDHERRLEIELNRATGLYRVTRTTDRTVVSTPPSKRPYHLAPHVEWLLSSVHA